MKDLSVVVAAVILGFSLLGGAYMVSTSIDSAASELQAVGDNFANVGRGLQAAAARPAAPAARPPRRGPDPEKVYAVNVKGSPARGPERANVTIVEFSDFQCPFCARVGPTLDRIHQEYGDKVRIVFKHLPLSIHPKAPAAHAAAEAAHRQGKFWEMHDKIFKGQRALSEESYVQWAGELGLDIDRFKRDLASSDVKGAVDRDSREASALGVTGTPGFFINGKFMSGAQPFSSFKTAIDAALAS